jgi:hypothetical protein
MKEFFEEYGLSLLYCIMGLLMAASFVYFISEVAI